jgi:NAD(P)-dependent dehydrogenase (short-subunit alcohol dehydrogenase family)
MNSYQAPPNLLKDRVILVTGAGQGLGQTAARAFAAHGATVILTGRNEQRLNATYDAIADAGDPEPVIFPLDLEKATDKDFAAMAEAIGGQLGRLDGILHNAARFDNLAPLELATLEQWLGTLRVNLAAPFALTRACLPLLRAAEDASVVMTSETHGRKPTAYWGAFGVSKWGLEALVKTWAQELELTPQVRINLLVPGPVQSPQRKKTHPAEVQETLPTADAVMPTYLYLMGPASRDRSGEIFDAQPGA